MKIGLALSGGGTRCVAHLAVIKVLEEQRILPHQYAGTSAGALAAALLAAGVKPLKILEIIAEAKLIMSIRPAFTRSGLLNVEKALSFSLKYLPETFEELAVPLFVGTTNVRTGEAEFFSKGPLIPALLASCSLPVIFKPVMIGGEYYVDGGLVNNLPVEPLQKGCDRIIGIHTNPVDRNFQLINMKSLLERTFLLTINSNVEQRKALCDVYLEPPCLSAFKVFDFRKVPAIFQQVTSWVEAQLPDIKSKLA